MVNRLIEVGHIAGLRITARASIWMTMLALWIVLTIVASLLGLPITEAVVGALVAVVIHYLSELVHQIGHSIAARQTGYPMSGVIFFGPIGLSVYPKDEPELSGRVHIKRALGGPVISLLLTLAAGLLYLFLTGTFTTGQDEPHLAKVIILVGLFFFLDNLLVFTLGALLPLGFTDGSTILRWWGK